MIRNRGQMTGTRGQDARATAGETPALRPKDFYVAHPFDSTPDKA